MFKNRLDAARQLKNKLEPDFDSKIEIKIISLTPGGNKIAKYLDKLLSSRPKDDQSPTETILIVDDGGSSPEKLIRAVKLYRQKNFKKIAVGIPVYKLDDILKLQKHADAVYTVYQPKTFISTEEFYISTQ